MYHYKQIAIKRLNLSIGKNRKVNGVLLIFRVYS